MRLFIWILYVFYALNCPNFLCSIWKLCCADGNKKKFHDTETRLEFFFIFSSLRFIKCLGCVHAEREESFLNLVQLNLIWIVYISFRLIWNQTDVRLVSSQSKNDKYSLISVWFNEISGRFFCVHREKSFLNLVQLDQILDCIYHVPNHLEHQTELRLVSNQPKKCNYNRNQIVFTMFRFIWNQKELRLVSNQPEKCYYNTNFVLFNKVQKIFLCV